MRKGTYADKQLSRLGKTLQPSKTQQRPGNQTELQHVLLHQRWGSIILKYFLGQMNQVGVKMCVIWSHAFMIAPHLTSQLFFLMPCKQIVTLGSCLTSFPRPWSASSVFFPTMAPFIVKHLLLPLCPVTNKQMNVLLLIVNNSLLQEQRCFILNQETCWTSCWSCSWFPPVKSTVFPPAVNWKCSINEKNLGCDWCCWGLFMCRPHILFGSELCSSQFLAEFGAWQNLSAKQSFRICRST